MLSEIADGALIGAVSSMIGLTALRLVAVLVKSNVPERSETRILRFHLVYQCCVCLLACGLLLGPYVIFSEAPGPFWLKFSVSFCLLLVALHLSLWVTSTRVSVSTSTVKVEALLRTPIVMTWTEICEVRFKKSDSTYVLSSSTSKHKIKVSKYMNGWKDFVRLAEQHGLI